MTRVGRFLRENGLSLLVLAALAAGYLALRSHPSPIGSPEEFALSLQGRPSVAYFYSNT